MDGYEQSSYSVPTYQAASGATWYHFLHGNVPGHQIDFIYRPVVPQGDLTRQHFSHLARLMKYIEPRVNTPYAFAIGNLSRDDTQYEPGHGGIALIFGLRVKGAIDHAGRQDPPFCHAAVSVDRQFDETALCEAAIQFYEQLLARPNSPSDGSRWYQSYVLHAQQFAVSTRADMHTYVQAFGDLPAPLQSDLGLRWTVEGVTAPRRVVIVYPDGTPFGALAQQMARVAAVLVESDIRWTAVSTGRDQDLTGGTTVRFVPESDAAQEPADVVSMHIRQLPVEPRDIALLLFGAQEVRLSITNHLRVQWRLRSETPAPDVTQPMEPPGARPWARSVQEAEKNANTDSDIESSTSLARPNVEAEVKKKRRSVPLLMMGLAMALVAVASGVVGMMAARGTANEVAAPRKPATLLQTAKTEEPAPLVVSSTQEAPKTVASVDVVPSATVVPQEESGTSVEMVAPSEPVKTSAPKRAPKTAPKTTNTVRNKVSGGTVKQDTSKKTVLGGSLRTPPSSSN